MKKRLKKWSNSVGIRFDKENRDIYGITVGGKIEFTVNYVDGVPVKETLEKDISEWGDSCAVRILSDEIYSADVGSVLDITINTVFNGHKLVYAKKIPISKKHAMSVAV